MSNNTGPLTLREFETLANLLRRFEVHHTGKLRSVQIAVVAEAWLLVRNVYTDLYVPNTSAQTGSEMDRRQQLLAKQDAEWEQLNATHAAEREALLRSGRQAEEDAATDPLTQLLDHDPAPELPGTHVFTMPAGGAVQQDGEASR